MLLFPVTDPLLRLTRDFEYFKDDIYVEGECSFYFHHTEYSALFNLPIADLRQKYAWRNLFQWDIRKKKENKLNKCFLFVFWEQYDLSTWTISFMRRKELVKCNAHQEGLDNPLSSNYELRKYPTGAFVFLHEALSWQELQRSKRPMLSIQSGEVLEIVFHYGIYKDNIMPPRKKDIRILESLAAIRKHIPCLLE